MKKPAEQEDVKSNGDNKAFEILVRANHKRLLAYALSLTRREAAAEDIVQDAFVVAYRKLATFDASRDFGKWMRGIVRMKYLEWIKANKEIPVEESTIEALEVEHGLWDAAVEDGRKDAFEALSQCMKKLADAARQVVHLFYIKQQSCSGIASIIGINEVSVKKRLQRAREDLAICVKQQINAGLNEG